ncbi:RNA polymerase sigma factor [Geofilum rubicundum]|uniref:RNA polymerase ECF-type sigma factor n=1 Tax=Geofilum rubicundum JCM 15548 TaxID=1236989 RepID=A0A0E9LWS3_9BACT|nr:RNA polymerase sigma factor [Geofilum rubicundum]GAO29325.1 RNA polymerase ECF-type sigma factor [Geofilum rubicundum JCM 15548]
MTEQAYNHCVELHADNLYRFILKNIKDEDKASDIVQDAYEKMWRYKEGVDPEKAKSYLFTTAYHVLVDTVKKDQKMVPFERHTPTDYYTDSQYSDLNDILHRAIDQLPADQKMVLMLRDYEAIRMRKLRKLQG